MTAQFPVRTICGSLRYWETMLDVAQRQTGSGVIILMPFVADYVGGKRPDARKIMLDEMHRVKIDMSECIIVVGLHIGQSTASEIMYAQETGKPVYYWDARLGALSSSRN